MYKCLMCKYTAKTEAAIRAHVRTAHRGVILRTSYRREDDDGTEKKKKEQAQKSDDHDPRSQVSRHKRRSRAH